MHVSMYVCVYDYNVIQYYEAAKVHSMDVSCSTYYSSHILCFDNTKNVYKHACIYEQLNTKELLGQGISYNLYLEIQLLKSTDLPTSLSTLYAMSIYITNGGLNSR